MIRMRAILVGLAAVIVLGIVTPCCDLFWIGSLIGSTYLPVGALFLFFFFVFILNTILKVFKVPLRPNELLIIYAMMAVSSGIPSFGYAVQVIPIITAPFYYATPENHYVEILQKFIPAWMAPQNPDVVKYLFEGLPKGMPIPFKAWFIPLFWWTLLTCAIYAVMLSLSIILRKQWVENEKLVFPLVYVPLEMVKEDEKNPMALIPPFFKNKIVWIAFLIPVVIYSIKGLHYYFPAVPDVNLVFDIAPFFTEKPLNSLNPFWMKIYFSVIGLTYLIPTALSFSLWFFYLFFQLQTVIGTTLGFQMPIFPNGFMRAFQAYQAAGSILVFGVLLFWAMRGELKIMFKQMFRPATPENKEEVNSFRVAWAGLVGGFLFICFWAMAAGVKFWAIFLWAAIFFLIIMVTTRLVAEGGLFYIHHEFYPLELIFPFTGSAAMGARSIFTLAAFNQIFSREYRATEMPHFMNNLKMADSAKMKKESFYGPMWLAIIVMICVSYTTILVLMYRYGGVNLTNWWTRDLPNQFVAARAAYYITTPVKVSIKDVMTMIIGGGVTIWLFWMRRMFLWWPFHPLGYMMGGGYAMHHIWFATFIGWGIKSIVLKTGGIKIYQKLMPAFIGLILGEFVGIGAWVVIDLISGARGNFLMWI